MAPETSEPSGRDGRLGVGAAAVVTTRSGTFEADIVVAAPPVPVAVTVPMPDDDPAPPSVDSIIACPVTWEGRWAFDDGRLIGDPAECDGDDRFAADVAEVQPDVILMMFGWPGTISGRELDDGTIVAPCEPGFDDRFADELAKLVERFEAEAAVVVATVAPPTMYRDNTQSDRPGCLNRVIRGGEFNVFDFGEWLCPGADCTGAVPLMRDTVHFADSPDVRAAVWPVVIEQVLDAARS